MSKLLLIAFAGHEAEALTGFAAKLGLPFDIASFELNIAGDLGAGTIFEADAVDSQPDVAAKSLAALASGYTHIAAVSSMRSKDVLARLAGRLDCGMITDAVSVESPSTFVRPIVAGSLLATVEASQFPVVLTVRPGGFPSAARSGNSARALFEVSSDSKVKVTKVAKRSGGRPDLTQAKRIVSGGKPLKDAETFEKLIGGLADKLGGAAGATRAAVDSGIADNELQVGQTGKIVAPDLYIAAGISGSTQHMAGIKDSKIIVAINKDSGAPIFEIADFGIVADLYDVLPELTAKV